MITESMFLLRQMGDYMSSDEIFAAQMWPWPDPMLKRNAEGRILFVNAAFLRIYGGQVQDWHGNSVGGWPLPLGGPAPNRFETRLPTPQGEMVFDWVEYTLADGGTLGLGRDVTELLTAPEPDPGYLTFQHMRRTPFTFLMLKSRKLTRLISKPLHTRPRRRQRRLSLQCKSPLLPMRRHLLRLWLKLKRSRLHSK